MKIGPSPDGESAAGWVGKPESAAKIGGAKSPLFMLV
jgi:hypothetical protein